jgi:hypothetical protein
VIDVAKLEPGTKVRLKGGITAEVVENPGDGMWVSVLYVAAPDDPGLVGTEDLAHADQILAVVGEAD